jgi:hypothetical protein
MNINLNGQNNGSAHEGVNKNKNIRIFYKFCRIILDYDKI